MLKVLIENYQPKIKSPTRNQLFGQLTPKKIWQSTFSHPTRCALHVEHDTTFRDGTEGGHGVTTVPPEVLHTDIFYL